jgi:IS5 family transposase
MGHALMENRHGLLVDFQLTQATGTAERDAVPELIDQARERGFEEIFGWMKMVGGFRRTRYRGLERTQLAGYLVATAYNLVRMVRLVSSATAA